MRASVLGAAAIAGRALAEAPPSTDNPTGVVYQAVLPDEPFFAGADIEGNVKGSITAVSREDGNGVRFTVKFENLPTEGGPFTYHIHEAAAIDGNCTTTKAHLDPFDAGVEIPCDSSEPQTCEVGDLAGKHGKIDSNPYEIHYTDLYASTNEDSESYFGDLSFVLHYANSTRLTCANFERKKKNPSPTPEPDCSAEEGAPTPTPAPMPTVEEEPPAVETVVVPCEKGCEEGGDEGEEQQPEKPEGEPVEEEPKPEDEEKPDEGEPIEEDQPEDEEEPKPEDEADEGEDQGEEDTVTPPPPQDDDVDEEAAPEPTPSEVPVEAGASMQRLSATLLSLGLAAAMFMSS